MKATSYKLQSPDVKSGSRPKRRDYHSGQTPRFAVANSGQAVIGSVIFLVLISTVIIAGFVGPLTRQLAAARTASNSRLSYFAAEGGVEDAIYRIKNNLTYASNYNLTVGSATVAITTGMSGNNRTIDVVGNMLGHQRLLSVEMDLSEVGANLFYGIQVSDGGLLIGNATVNGNVYSNGSIVGNNGAIITGDAVVAGGLNENATNEWTAQDADQAFATVSGNRDIAQSFTASASGSLNKVAVYLGKVGPTGPTSNLTLRLTSDNSGKPSTSDLANTSIAYTSVGFTPSWVYAAFASPPTLVSGTTYWIVLDYGSNSATNYWNWRRDVTTDYANNTGKYTSNCCSGNPSWTDLNDDLAFQVWIGGTNNKIDNVTIGDATTGIGQANLFVNTTIRGSSCPNYYCQVTNPSWVPLPISDGVIDDWRADAALGDIIDSDLSVNTTTSLGPKQIGTVLAPRNLTIDIGNDEVLTISGTIWVTGNLTFSCANGSQINLDAGYGTDSGVIVVDGTVDVGNNCTFNGSGDPASYLMVLSDKNQPDSDQPVMTVSNNSNGVVYYANRGWIKLSQRASAKEITAYGIVMENNSTVTYETGLASLIFTSGPGGGFAIMSWQETE